MTWNGSEIWTPRNELRDLPSSVLISFTPGPTPIWQSYPLISVMAAIGHSELTPAEMQRGVLETVLEKPDLCAITRVDIYQSSHPMEQAPLSPHGFTPSPMTYVITGWIAGEPNPKSHLQEKGRVTHRGSELLTYHVDALESFVVRGMRIGPETSEDRATLGKLGTPGKYQGVYMTIHGRLTERPETHLIARH